MEEAPTEQAAAAAVELAQVANAEPVSAEPAAALVPDVKSEPDVKTEPDVKSEPASEQAVKREEEQQQQQQQHEQAGNGTSTVSVDKDVVLARLKDILPTVDFETTSEKMLRKQLEGEFGADFTEFKTDIRKTIEEFMDAQAGDDEEEEQAPEPKKRKAGGGFGKMCRLSAALQEFLGVETESRPQVVKKLWDYIKENNLQDPKDKRKIKPDEKLKKIFPKPVTMFSMNKVLSEYHIFKADGEPTPKRKRAASDDEDEYESSEEEEEEDGGSKGKGKGKSKAKKSKKAESDDEEDDEDDEDDDGDYKAPKKTQRKAPAKRDGASKGGGGGGGFTKLYTLSPELREVVGEEKMTRGGLQKFFTGYFKENGLLDPSDKRKVKCNDKLKELFKVDSFNAFGGIQKLVGPHLS